MKYIKTFEKKIKEYLYPVSNSDIEETFKYLYDLGAEPRILTHHSNYGNPYLLYYKNVGVNSFIFNRSYLATGDDLKNLEIDKELEKSMKLIVTTNKYNI